MFVGKTKGCAWYTHGCAPGYTPVPTRKPRTILRWRDCQREIRAEPSLGGTLLHGGTVSVGNPTRLGIRLGNTRLRVNTGKE